MTNATDNGCASKATAPQLANPSPWLLRVRERFIGAGGNASAFNGAVNAYANEQIKAATNRANDV